MRKPWKRFIKFTECAREISCFVIATRSNACDRASMNYHIAMSIKLNHNDDSLAYVFANFSDWIETSLVSSISQTRRNKKHITNVTYCFGRNISNKWVWYLSLEQSEQSEDYGIYDTRLVAERKKYLLMNEPERLIFDFKDFPGENSLFWWEYFDRVLEMQSYNYNQLRG